jgi:hypothetical protein
MMHGRPLIVIGNGPSLRGVSLDQFSHIDTVGMNAAYRAWERRGWWPTYYVCADHRLALSHVGFFREAAAAERFERMLVPASILSEAPELASNPRVEFLDQYLEFWFNQFGRTAGLARLQHNFFESIEPSLVTTGAISIRWAASLGYSKIGLIGVDCRYVALPAWQAEEGLSLRMAETPTENPNYFFEDYQREGDLFNVPQPGVHGANLHLAAIAAVRDDFRIQQAAVTLVNLSEQSELLRQGTLAFQTLDSFLDGSGISVVLLDCRREWSLPAARSQLEAMGDPQLLPCPSQTEESATLLMLVPEATSVGEIKALEAFYRDDFHLPQQFRDLLIVRCDAGLPIQNIITGAKVPKSGFALHLDAWARPLRFGWLDELTEMCRRHGSARGIFAGTGPTSEAMPLVNLAATSEPGHATSLIIDLAGQAPRPVEEIRASNPGAALALNCDAAPASDISVKERGWHRYGDRLLAFVTEDGGSQKYQWHLGREGSVIAAIIVRAVEPDFRAGDEIEVQVGHTGVGASLLVDIEAWDSSSLAATSSPFETGGIGRYTFRAALMSHFASLKIKVRLAEASDGDGFDQLTRIDSIHVTHRRRSLAIARARVKRVERQPDNGLGAGRVLGVVAESRVILPDGQSTYRYRIMVSTETGATEDCSVHYGGGNLVVAIAGRLIVVEDFERQEPSIAPENPIIDAIGRLVRAHAAAQI